MKVDGKPMRTIWLEPDGSTVGVIDQTRLPHGFAMIRLTSLDDAARAIKTMQVRGAPLIGAAAAYGVCLALKDDASDESLARAYAMLSATRPTAINLTWALEEMVAAVRNRAREDRVAVAYRRAAEIADEDVAINQAIGRHGLPLIAAIAAKKKAGERVNVLTHCNAGWLATVDVGTATAPIYAAHDQGVPLHVCRRDAPAQSGRFAHRLGSSGQHGVPHTVIADNTGGHLMQHARASTWSVVTDRVTARGDACDKTGTKLRSLTSRDTGVPFDVMLPTPTISFSIANGIREIPIEERAAEEVATIAGKTADGRIETVRVVPDGSDVANYGFDVTPARLVTGLITERGVFAASREALAKAFPERAAAPKHMISAEPAE